MDRSRPTLLRAWLHGLLLWSLLFSSSSTSSAAASVAGKCLTRPVSLTLGTEQFTFCAPTGLPSNLVKDNSSPETAYAQFSQVDGYGLLNIKSLASGAGPGPGRPLYRGQGAAGYLRQVQDLETQKPDRAVTGGPAASLWGERVRGIAIETGLAGMRLRSIEWYVEHAGRLWVFVLAWDAGMENAQEWARAAQTLSIEAAPLAGPDAAIDLGEAFLRSQQAAPGSELVDVGTPAWWSGVCNDGNYYLAGTRPHSFELGGSFHGVPSCGPRPYTVSTPDHLVNFFPGAWGTYEFECVELVMRFLYQQWGIPPWRGNGNTIKDYAPASLTFYPNGTHAISPGDILTENGTTSNAFGHAAVITAVNLDAAGTGTINILEQNSDPDGARSLHVTNWNVDPDAWTHGPTIQGWLHHRSTDRVSVGSGGTQAGNESGHPAISADGRYVAFESIASDLVSGDANGFRDIFLHDRESSDTTLVSLAADGDSSSPSVSADGRYIAFESAAANLVSGDTNSARDIFVYDRVSATTARVSVDSGGAQAAGDSWDPSISADGRYVAFESDAAGLVPGDTNGMRDIFVHDSQTGVTLRVSVASGGGQANGAPSFSPAISADGRYIAFESQSPSLVPQDTNGAHDIFVHDLQSGETSRVSVPSDSAQANGSSYFPSISADGRFVAFESTATDMVAADTNGLRDVFVHDRQAGDTQRMSVASDGTQADGESRHASISADGRLVAFSSAAGLVAGDTNGMEDVFVHSRLSGATTRASVASGGGQSNGASGLFSTSLSGDGRFLAFHSAAANLVVGDTNGVADVFVRDNGLSLLTISGDAGAAGVTLSYNDGSPRSVTSAADGSYSLQVPAGWSGTVTPSRTGYTFTPEGRTYPSLAADQSSQDYTATTYLKVMSKGPEDGWLLESSETSNQGGSMDATAAVFNLGDDAENKQYRALLSFDTAGLPDDAVIERATLKIRRAGISGTNPFFTHMGLKVDIRKPWFGAAAALVPQDFQAAAGKLAVGVFIKTPSTDWWYTAVLGSTAYPYINLAGTTQLRLRFLIDDNNDLGADYLKFYSGNVLNTANRPQFIVWYHVP